MAKKDHTPRELANYARHKSAGTRLRRMALAKRQAAKRDARRAQNAYREAIGLPALPEA